MNNPTREELIKHNYKTALEWFNKANWDERVPEIQAIRHALKLAQKVMEPSEGIVEAGYREYLNGNSVSFERDIFKAMITAAIREIEE